MRVRSAVDGSVPPNLRDPEALDRALVAACMRDVVFRSRAAAFDGSASDYIHALTKPHRDAGALPTFENIASYAAFVLALPPEMAEGW